MKAAKTFAVAALLVGLIALIAGHAAAGAKHSAILVVNSNDVTAYPAGSKGNVAPIALTIDMAAPSGFARDASGRLYVTNGATNTVTIYPANANGNVPPLAVIGGPNTMLSKPAAIALDASGKIYVLNDPFTSAVGINVYPPLGASTGILDEAPVAVIAGSNTLLDLPGGIALDAQGNIYVTNEFSGPNGVYQGMLAIYSAGSDGNVAPMATISGVATGLTGPGGIALDSDGKIYVANAYTDYATGGIVGSITVYPAGSNGNVAPIATITGDITGFGYIDGIALDSNRNIYVGGYSNAGAGGYDVNLFPAGSNGNVSPAATIIGPDTGLDLPIGIALDSGGGLYVLNFFGGTPELGSVTVYRAGSSGDATPIATITSRFTGLYGPQDIAVDAGGNIYVTNSAGGADNLGSVTVYSAVSLATGPPIATIAGDDTGLDYPSGIGLDSSGNIFVLNSEGNVTEYPAGSAGDVFPVAIINVRRGNKTPTSIAVNSHDNIYAAFADSVCVYPATSHGRGMFGLPSGAKPSAIISGPDTGLASSTAVALDHRGNIYVTNEGPVTCVDKCCAPNGHGSITVYAPASNGNAKPLATIGGPKTGLKFPYRIALDSDGSIYVLNSPDGPPYVCPGGFFTHGVPKRARKDYPVLTFAAGSNGDIAPIARIGGPFTGLDDPAGIAITPDGPVVWGPKATTNGP